MNLKAKTLLKDKWILLVLAVQALLLTVFFVKFHFFSAMFESDAAAEVLLAENVLKEGHFLFSNNWIYGLEIRVFHNQIFIEIGYLLFHSFRLAYAFSEVAFMLILGASGYYLLRSLNVSKFNSSLGVLLLWLPYGGYRRYSVFSMFLGNNYYSAHVVLELLFLGTWFQLKKNTLTKKTRNILTAVECLLALLMGMCSVRQLLLVFLPLAAWEVGSLIARKKDDIVSAGDMWKFIKTSILELSMMFVCVISSLVGYVINSKVLMPRFHTLAASELSYANLDDMIPQSQRMTSGILKFTGFDVEHGNVMSLMGVENLFFLIYTIVLVCMLVFIIKKKVACREYTIFLAVQIAINLAILLILDIDDVAGMWRYTWLGMYGLLLLPSILLNDKKVPTIYKLVTVVMVVGMFLTTNFNLFTTSINRNNRLVRSYSDGIVYNENRNATAEEREGYINYLRSNGYTYGIATFWNGNITSVLSEGDVRVSAVNNDSEWTFFGVLQPYDYSDRNAYVPQFIILSNFEVDARSAAGLEIPEKVLYQDAKFTVFAY